MLYKPIIQKIRANTIALDLKYTHICVSASNLHPALLWILKIVIPTASSEVLVTRGYNMLCEVLQVILTTVLTCVASGYLVMAE
jgi:hypothetical protein